MSVGNISSLSPAKVSGLIGLIYDCAIDPQRWPSTLEALRQILGFRYAILALQSLPASSPLLSATSGIDSRWLEAIPQYSADYIDRWGGRETVENLPLEEPAVLSWVNPRRNWESTRYYIEWQKPQGIIDILAIGVARDSLSIGSVVFGRHSEFGEITTADVDAARLFIPHLQRAVAISRILEIKALAAATFEATLDALSAAVFLVTADLHIVHANRAATDMLLDRGLIYAQRHQLSIRSIGATSALLAAVAQTASDESHLNRKGFGIPVRGTENQSCVLHVLPLKIGSIRCELIPDAKAAIFVAQATVRPPSAIAAASALFDLTAAESSVLDAIVAGRSIAETAAILHNSVATVKTHLQHIFDKTSVRKQVELVALIGSLSLPLEK